MATPEYIHKQLLETLNIDVSVAVIKQLLAENAFLFVTSPNREGLWDGQVNKFEVIPTYELVLQATNGWTFASARVLSANVLSGANPL
jgi:hypothetical protein